MRNLSNESKERGSLINSLKLELGKVNAELTECMCSLKEREALHKLDKEKLKVGVVRRACSTTNSQLALDSLRKENSVSVEHIQALECAKATEKSVRKG